MQSAELHRLEQGASKSWKSGLLIMPVVASCSGNADVVLSRIREVMRLVLATGGEPHLLAEISLPDWFVEYFSREDGVSTDWTPGAWLDKQETSERSWYWWDGQVQSSAKLMIYVQVDGHAFGDADLEVLIKAAGADSVEVDP